MGVVIEYRQLILWWYLFKRYLTTHVYFLPKNCRTSIEKSFVVVRVKFLCFWTITISKVPIDFVEFQIVFFFEFFEILNSFFRFQLTSTLYTWQVIISNDFSQKNIQWENHETVHCADIVKWQEMSTNFWKTPFGNLSIT